MISIYLVQSTLLSSWYRASSHQKALHPCECGFWWSRPIVDTEHLCLPCTLGLLDYPSSSVSQESLCADGGERWLFHLNRHKAWLLGKQTIPEIDSSVEQNGRSREEDCDLLHPGSEEEVQRAWLWDLLPLKAFWFIGPWGLVAACLCMTYWWSFCHPVTWMSPIEQIN